MKRRTIPSAAAHPAVAFGPSPFGLTRAELRTEVRRLAAAGWSLWELRTRFGHPGLWGSPWT
ncbi:hypothetical protein ACEZDB_26850 [Streptacidiphilus sp. N1-3]|uniref:Uncharacterized protein n=1 Tax=Streptacidiphilus alkalitolerans TaxID=3342712 RepID=A0ABV6X8C2_9ACTN